MHTQNETIALYDVQLAPDLRYVLAAVKTRDRKYLYLLYQEGEIAPKERVLLIVPGMQPVLEKVQVPKWAEPRSDMVLALYAVKSFLTHFIIWEPTYHADDPVWQVLTELAYSFEVRVPDPELRRKVLEVAKNYAVEIEEVLDVLRVRKLIAEDGERYEKYVLEIRPGLWYVMECVYGEQKRWVKVELYETTLMCGGPGRYSKTFMYWYRKGKGRPKPPPKRSVLRLGPYVVYEDF